MEVTQESVKTWLSRHPERDRNWLADKCGTEKSTVANWLSTARGIPAKAILIIENLMRADEAAHSATAPALSNLVLRIDTDEFEDWSHAGLAKNQTVTEYALSAIRAAREAELVNAPIPNGKTTH